MAARGLDDLDLRIIAELQEDGRRSYREIGSRLRVSAGTIRARALQLMQEGVLEVIAVPNPWRMGFKFFAAIGLRLHPGNVEEVASDLAAREEVSWVGLLATGYELMFEVVLADAQAFGRYREEVLAKLPGFISADVYLLWDVRKLHYHMGTGWSSPRIEGDGREPTAAPAGGSDEAGRRTAEGTDPVSAGVPRE